MSKHELLEDAVGALSRYFVGDATLGDTLRRVAELTRDALPQTTFVGVTMVLDGRPGTYVFTDPDVAEIDRRQYETGLGPCMHAYRENVPVVIASTVLDTDFPEFCASARAHGVLSTLSLPLVGNEAPVGALNLYADREVAYRPTDVDDGRIFATQAAVVLSNAQAYWDARTLSEDLTAAMRSRATIEQAKGIIMGAMHCSAEEAFEQLVAQSQHENVKLRDVAARIVEHTLRAR